MLLLSCFSCVWLFDSPGKNTGVGCHFFLSRGSSQPRDRTCISCSSCIGRCGLYRSATGSPKSQLFNLDEFFKESAHVCSVVSESLQPHGLYSTRLLYPWNFPSKNTGMGCHFLHQGIFPTQGLNPHLHVFWMTGRFFTTEPLGKLLHGTYLLNNF